MDGWCPHFAVSRLEFLKRQHRFPTDKFYCPDHPLQSLLSITLAIPSLWLSGSDVSLSRYASLAESVEVETRFGLSSGSSLLRGRGHSSLDWRWLRLPLLIAFDFTALLLNLLLNDELVLVERLLDLTVGHLPILQF